MAAGIALVLTASAQAAETGILGFHPGMPADAVAVRLAALSCADDTCKIGSTVLQLRRASDKSVKQVAYRFTSSLKPRDQITATAKQYGVRTARADIGDIGYAMGRYEVLPIVGSRLMTGGEICRWSLGDGRRLVLMLDEPGTTFTYILFLTNEKSL